MSLGRFSRKLVDDAVDLATTAACAEINSDMRDVLEEVRSTAVGQLADAVAELTDAEQRQLRKHVQPGVGHLLCAIAAGIGEACASITSVPGEVAGEIGDVVKSTTGSALIGKVAKSATNKWLSGVVALTPLGHVQQMGLVADTVAVGACPAQETPKPYAHPEVVACGQRLQKKVVEEEVEQLLSG